MTLFIQNFPFDLTTSELQAHFDPFGPVVSCKIIFDHETGKSRGFGYVEMENDADGELAINSLNRKDFGGRRLTVIKARPRYDQDRGFGRQERRGR